MERSFPIQSNKYRLEVTNLKYSNLGQANSVRRYAQAKLKDGSHTVTLTGDVKMVDQAGKVIDQKRDKAIAVVPAVTKLGTFMLNGKDVQIVNQVRRRPGVYTGPQMDGNVSARITTAGGEYRIIVDREKSRMLVKIRSRHFPLYTLLQALGATEQQQKEALGDYYEQTKSESNPNIQMPEMRNLLRRTEAIEDPATEIREFFESKPMDAGVNQQTLGGKYGNISLDAVIAAARKARDVTKGEREPDDMESMAFKTIHSAEDHIAERLEKIRPQIQGRIKYMMEKTGTVDRALPISMFSQPIIGFFTASSLSRYSGQMSPLSILSQNLQTTVMGEGGIQSDRAISDSLRTVHPSHMGVYDPSATSESSQIGITNHLALGASKEGNEIVVEVIDAKTGKRIKASTVELGKSVLAFSDSYQDGKWNTDDDGKVSAIGESRRQLLVDPKEVDYILPAAANMFSAVSAQIPFIQNNSANRVLMAGRHMEQASPLVDPDAPGVVATVNGKPVNKILHDEFQEKSPVDGVVEQARTDKIIIRGLDGGKHVVEIHDSYPLNDGTWLKQRPSVAAGQRIKKGQSLTTDNFSAKGQYSTGKNLRTAFMPWKGLTFEDAMVVSETAAKKLTSEHMYELRIDKEPGIKVGFAGLAPLHVSGLGNISAFKGDLPRVGSKFKEGDVVIPAVAERHVDATTAEARGAAKLRRPFTDASVRWKEPYSGIVKQVVDTPRFVKVLMETNEALQSGDKLSGRAGNKGIVSAVLPDSEMPKDSKGKPFEVLFNPMGTVGRVNPGLMYEAAAGKLAEQTGKQYAIESFDPESSLDKVRKDLRWHRMNDTETVTDPNTGDVHEDVGGGVVNWIKLKHSIHKKWSARSNDGYTREERPAKGRPTSAQSVGPMEMYSLLSNGSTEFVKDVSRLTSNRNDKYWTALQLGQPTPPPETPFVFDKFKAHLAGAGINVEQDGNNVKATPFTDHQVMKMSKGEITSPHTVRAKDLEPEKGGLFDEQLTGGFQGDHFNHITLGERIPNPLYERPIASILGLTANKYQALVTGAASIENTFENYSGAKGNLTGGPAVEYLLSKVDAKNMTQRLQRKLSGANKTEKPKILKQLRYLGGLNRLGMKADEAYMTKNLPVIPARFRPVYNNNSGQLVVSDPNHVYREVMLVNDQLKNLKNLEVDDEGLQNSREGLYSAVSGAVGISEPLTRNREFKGFISTIAGKRNKTGLFQGKVIHRPVDLSGRSTTIPDHKLGLDEVGLPKNMAFKQYSPFIIRRLVRAGMDPSSAKKNVTDQTDAALRALQEEMKERPVIMNRAPSLHKFSTVSLMPKLTDGLAIKSNPLIVSGLNMDHDGDTVAVHVPVSEKARVEALGKLPSKNFMAPRTKSVMHTPSKEMLLGIYLITKPRKMTSVVVKSATEALQLFRDKKIRINDGIIYRGNRTTAGQFLMRGVFPPDIQWDFSKPLDGGTVQNLINQTGEKHPEALGAVLNQIKDIGFNYVTALGFSVSLKDLDFGKSHRQRILRNLVKNVRRFGPDEAYKRGISDLEKLMDDNKEGNRFVEMSVDAKAIGKKDAVRQLILAPVAFQDNKGKPVPVPIDRSYAEGLKPSQYFASFAGARTGLAGRALGTRDTGAFSKELLNTTLDVKVTIPDCKTRKGIMLPITHNDVLDRYGIDAPYHNKLITTEVISSLRKKHQSMIRVRSPMYCEASDGVCQMCSGLNENGNKHSLGYHIGAMAGQAIAEPTMQSVMRAFHSGGAVGGQELGFKRIYQVMSLPNQMKGQAPIAEKSGIVTNIQNAPGHGWNVEIEGKKYFIPKELGISVKNGQHVTAGTKLSKDGVVHPVKLTEVAGIDKGRTQLISDLNEAYQDSGISVRQRIFETVAKPMTDKVKIIDPGAASWKYGVTDGEVLSANVVAKYNRNLPAGQRIKADPVMLGIKQVPFARGDFISPLMHQRLPKHLSESAALGKTTDVSKGSPIAQFAFGFPGEKAKT